ncbi:MAG: hypothetical protein ACFFDN_20965 [Candidatus Hodarchaeota archaeon]
MTPTHNEELFKKKILHLVVAQTIMPKRWAIISNGSTPRMHETMKSHTD